MTAEFDVVIVGSGATGLVAALTAAARGLTPLVVEKSELLGGSSALSGGGLWIPNNPLSRGADSAEAALRYLAATAGADSSAERQAAFVRAGPDMVSFLLKAGLRLRWSKGYPDYHPDLPGASTSGRCVEASVIDGAKLGPWLDTLRLRPSALAVPMYTTEIRWLGLAKRTLRGYLTELWVTSIRKFGRNPALTGGASLVGQLVRLATGRGAEVWLNTTVTELVVRDGRVTGVVVSRDGETRQIDAASGVFLAAGGFAHNDEPRQQHLPHPTGEDFHRGGDAYDRYYGDPRVRPNPNLSALDTPPYYACPIYPGDLGTKGGLLTDEHARVLHEDGSVIAGLYAAGNTTASVMGRSYPGPGCTIGAAMVFAYLGALHAAQSKR